MGLYPGSFNPWHKGHTDILVKALSVFKKVRIVIMRNPDKEQNSEIKLKLMMKKHLTPEQRARVEYGEWTGLLRDYLEIAPEVTAVVRGLRNGADLQYEQNMQYWNEDLGIKVPFVFFISDRSLGHISSSAIRAIERFS